MSELTVKFRGRGASPPHVVNARDFFCRLVKRDPGLKSSTASWLSKRLASREPQAGTLKAKPYWDWYERGEALRRNGHCRQALANFDRALALKRDYATAWHARGRALAELGRYFEAVASYMTALKLEPTNLFVRQDRTTALANLRRQRQTAVGGRRPKPEIRPCVTGRRASVTGSSTGRPPSAAV